MDRYGAIVVYAVLVFLFLFVAKKIADRLTSFDDDAAVENERNLAVALRRFGLYAGIGCALFALMGQGFSPRGIYLFIGDGALVLLLFFVAYCVNRYGLLRGINNDIQVRAGNTAAGVVEAANFLAAGILLNGAFAGEGGGIAGTAAFFLLAQIVMVLAVELHHRVFHYSMGEEVEAGNVSAGVSVAGVLISYSLILRSSIAGNFSGWGASLFSFAVSAVTGIVCLLIFYKAADFVFLPGTTIKEQIRQENLASLLVLQGVVLALSLVISQIL